MKICYMNDDRKRTSYRSVSLEEAVEDIRSGRFAKGAKRLREIVSVLFNHSFWREFFAVDILEEGRMTHDLSWICVLAMNKNVRWC